MGMNVRINFRIWQLQNSILLIAWVVSIGMLLSLFPFDEVFAVDCNLSCRVGNIEERVSTLEGLESEVSTLQDSTSYMRSGLLEYGSSQIAHGSHLSHFSLTLGADRDNSSSHEDIIFGFDGWNHDDVKEKMRLNDEGRLGIGTPWPNAVLDARYIPDLVTVHDTVGSTVGTYDFTHTVGRLGINPHVYDAGVQGTRNNYHGLSVVVDGLFDDRKFDARSLAHRTSIGFDILSAATERWTTGATALDIEGNQTGTGAAHAENSNRHQSRALTMEMDLTSSNGKYIKVAMGHNSDYRPTEMLDVNGAIRIGDTSNSGSGTMRFSNGVFEGYDGSQWLNLGQSSEGDQNLEIRGGHQLVFGSIDSHLTPNNFIVNSLNVPTDNAAQFPILGSSDNYNTDDAGTTGGVALISNGRARFTVKGNGNTYIHKRLSIGIGGHVEDTVLTVAGAVHIGPDNLTPSTFDYGEDIADYLLWVEHGIVSEDFALANVDNWSDHVLQDDYDLKPLSEVENFIQKKGHLPGVPSAEDVKESGYTVHEMTRTLLEKVEELTLHTIAQQKALEHQQAEIASLRAQLNEGNTAMQTAALRVKTGFDLNKLY